MANPDSYDVAKELEDSLLRAKKLQNDTYQDLAKTINLLKRVNELRESSVAKVKALNRESINTRDIEKEIRKVREKDEVSKMRIQRLESQLTTVQQNSTKAYITSIELRTKKEEELKRATEIRDRAEMARLSSLISGLDTQIERAETSLNIDQRQYAAALQSKKVSQENIDLLKEELDLEKKIKSDVGFTGTLMGKFSESLGLGTKAYEKMVARARDLREEGQELTFMNKLGSVFSAAGETIADAWKDPALRLAAIAGAIKLMSKGLSAVGNAAGKAGNALAGMSQDSSNIIRGLTGGISSMVKNIPLVGGLLGGLIDGFSAVLDLIIGIDNTIVKAGRQLNLSRDQARQLNRQYQDLSFNSGNVFINSKKLLETQVELTDQLGTTNILNKEILQTSIMLKEFAGLDAETRGSIAQSSLITKKSSESVVKSVMAQVIGLKQATGIQFQYQKILKEAASLGGYLGLQFAKYPDKLTKSLLTTKSLGLELKKLDGMASGFLDFESSISKEFEAQLLTGKDLNMAKAREAFLNNDLATAAAEITRQVGTSSEFLQMRRIEAESMADLFGLSRDEMGDMLKQQEHFAAFNVKNTKELQAQVMLYKQQGREQDAINLLKSKEEYQNIVTASTQERIANTIEKIKQSIVDFVERTGLIEKIERFVEKLTDPKTIKGIIGTIRDAISDFVAFMGGIIADVARFVSHLPYTDKELWQERADTIEVTSQQMSDKIRGMGGDLSTSAAKEKVASGGGMAAAAPGQSVAGNQKMMGVPTIHTTVQMRDKAVFDIAWTGYQEGSKFDQQMTTKNNANSHQ